MIDLVFALSRLHSCYLSQSLETGKICTSTTQQLDRRLLLVSADLKGKSCFFTREAKLEKIANALLIYFDKS